MFSITANVPLTFPYHSTMGYNHVIPASVYARGGRELVPRGRRVVLDPKTGKEKIESYIIDFVTPAAGVPKHN